MSQNRTEKKVVAQVRRFAVNGSASKPPVAEKSLLLEIVTEQRGLYTIKYIRGGELGCSRDYVTTSDEVAVRSFVGEHGLGLVKLAGQEFKIEQFPIFVSMETAHGEISIVKVMVSSEQCGDMVRVRLEQCQHDGFKFVRFVQRNGKKPQELDLLLYPMSDLKPSAPFDLSAGSFTKGLTNAVRHWVEYCGHKFFSIEQHVENLHLQLSTLGMNKKTMLNNYHDNDWPRCFDLDLALMKDRRQQYSIPELCIMHDWLTVSHDDCVLDFPEDFTPLEVHNARRRKEKQAKVAEALALIVEGSGGTVDQIAQGYRESRRETFPHMID
jgi:hypothetical protein